MSEKRFECDSQDVQFSIYIDGRSILVNPTYVVNLLNYFVEEKKKWKTFVEQYSNECNVLQKENAQLRHAKDNCRKQQSRQANTIHELLKEKEYYREYALQYLSEYEFYSDNFLNTIKNTMGEEEVKKIKEEQNKIREALKKEGLDE